MLTEDEKKWLEEREQVELRHGLYSCGHCKWHSDVFDEYTGYCAAEFRDCPIMGNFREAAEFEARVAAKLATVICAGCEDFNKKDVCPLAIYQAIGLYECRMKHARLAVEREMIAEGKGLGRKEDI